MKKALLFIFPVAAMILLPAFTPFHDENQGFAVVELFTSEGCSSCPPADEAVAALSRQYPSGVYVLSFHVDYWDRLGWKDPFSSAVYTQRQRQYSEQFKLSSIYTPQVVVNGKTEFVGSDAGKLKTTVEGELAHTSNLLIEASAKNTNGKAITVSYTLKKASNAIVQAVLLQLKASTSVKRGENAGRQLQHVDIVRDLKTAQGNSGTLNLDLPAGLAAGDCRVLLFVQDKDDLHITGATSISIH